MKRNVVEGAHRGQMTRLVATDWTKPPRERGPKPGPRALKTEWLHPIMVAPSAREIEVLVLISDGLTNGQIAGKLFLSEETVKSHVRHLLTKLQARNRAHLVTQGFLQGFLTTG